MARSDWAMLESRDGRPAGCTWAEPARARRHRSFLPRRAHSGRPRSAVPDQGRSVLHRGGGLFLTYPLGFSNPRVFTFYLMHQQPLQPRRADGRPLRRLNRVAGAPPPSAPWPSVAWPSPPCRRRRLRRLGQPRGVLDPQARLYRPGQGLRRDKGGRRRHHTPLFGPSGTQATSVINGQPGRPLELLAGGPT